MSILEIIRDVFAVLLITGGLILFIIEIYGVFRFSFVLNRMHAAAIGDTLALTMCLTIIPLFSLLILIQREELKIDCFAIFSGLCHKEVVTILGDVIHG